MRQSFNLFAVLCALTFGATTIGYFSRPSSAQQGKGSSQAIAADLLFDGPESVGMRGGPGHGTSWLVDFVKKAQASGSQCPLDVNVTVMYGPKDLKELKSGKYDPLFSQALAAARRDVLTGILNGFGPSVRVTANVTKGLVNMVTVDARSAQDKEKPKLHTTSVPPKGSKVKPRQEIVVTMKARDDANRWQSGIKTVTLVADSEGDKLIAGPTYPPHAAGCTDTPPEREVRATYIVPDNPPPIVRLTATAMDHVGLTDFDVGEFPTGDWYGTLNWTHIVANPRATATTTARADLSLAYDGKGGLTGRMVGTHSSTSKMGPCAGSTTTPGGIQTSLVGSYTPGRDAMTIRADGRQTTPTHMRISCPGAKPVVAQQPLAYEHYERALTGLRPTAGGGFESSHDQQYPCEAGSTCTTKITLTLRPAK